MKQIKDFPNYSVTEDGRVWSHRRNKFLKPLMRNGYIYVDLCNSKTKHKNIHRLVAESYIPNAQCLPCVNHKNGIKTDNRVDNLEWVSYLGNYKHALNNNLAPVGEKHGNSKLTQQDVLRIREMSDSGFSQRKIAAIFKVHQSTIWSVINKVTWHHTV